MSTEVVKLTEEETTALNRIDAELKGLRPSSGEAAAAGVDLCEKYKAIKVPLQLLVKILRKIPGFGGKAADALEFLMSIADTFCTV